MGAWNRAGWEEERKGSGMKHPTDSGMNKTGIDMSPIDVQELLDGVDASRPSSEGDESTLAHIAAVT